MAGDLRAGSEGGSIGACAAGDGATTEGAGLGGALPCSRREGPLFGNLVHPQAPPATKMAAAAANASRRPSPHSLRRALLSRRIVKVVRSAKSAEGACARQSRG